KQYRTHNIKTQAAYKAAVERFLRQFSDDKQVTPKSLKQWVIAMADEDELAAKTITRMINQAESFWSYLIEYEIVQRNPNPFADANLAVPKSATKKIEVLPFTPEEVVGFLRSPVAQGDEQLSLLITLGMYTGARIEELAML